MKNWIRWGTAAVFAVVMAVATAGCSGGAGDDDDDDGSSPTPTPTPVPEAPVIALGSIGVSAVTPTGLTLSWSPAYDEETAHETLSYRVYRSSADDIDTLPDVLANGTALAPAATGTYSLTVTGLEPLTDYWFNVVVTDESQLSSAYEAAAATTGEYLMYLYAAPETVLGNFGGRAPADAICQAARDVPYATLPCSTVRAFVSTGATTGAIFEMPGLYGVPTDRAIVGPAGARIGENWADLLDGAIQTSIGEAVGITTPYWTGANDAGQASNACFSGGVWNLASGGAGRSGDPAATNQDWLQNADSDCGSSFHLLCLCY